MQIVRVIMVGDVVGDSGLEVLERRLPRLIEEHSADFAVVNGENAAGGFGLTAETLERIFAAGADVVTGGNHIWEKRDFLSVLESETRVLRPMNYPQGVPGRGWVLLEKPARSGNSPVAWLTVNLQGRELMPLIDCPFRAFDALETGSAVGVDTAGAGIAAGQPLILVDFHAESSREKEALAYYLDGRASVVAGTHTHIQTADERILPGGTAYITDLGMTGTQDGIIGMDTKICLDRARNQVLYRMEAAAPTTESGTAVKGIIAEIDADTRKALSITRV